MAGNNLFHKDDLKILNEENEINDAGFQEFHKKIFNEMMEQSVFLAVEILSKQGMRPGVGDFDQKCTELIRQIMDEKINLLGNYLKKWTFIYLLFDFGEGVIIDDKYMLFLFFRFFIIK